MEHVVGVVSVHQKTAHALIEIAVNLVFRRKHFDQYEQEVAHNAVACNGTTRGIDVLAPGQHDAANVTVTVDALHKPAEQVPGVT